MINKISLLPKREKNILYKKLQNMILEYISYDGISKEELQKNFEMLRKDKVYEEILQVIIDEYEELGLELKDFKKLTSKKWKICSVCEKPFMSVDKYNGSVVCYNVDYVKFNMKSSKWYKAVEEDVSECMMKIRAERSTKYKLKNAQ